MTPDPVPTIEPTRITSRTRGARSASAAPLQPASSSQRNVPVYLQTQTRAELEAATNVALLAIWNRHLPGTRERVAQLDRAAGLAADGLLTTPLRTDAAMTAHKLAGSLGTFGFGEGTRIARSIEQLLDAPDAPDSPAAPNLLRLTRELRESLPL